MKTHNFRNNEKKYSALALLFILPIFSLAVISAASSTSIYSAQYFPPSVTGQFSSLMSGPTTSFTGTTTGEDEFFDMQLFIPPLGCQPYVVRSDLLEEQNVPVFCQLVPIKINPGIDITRIDSISIVQKESSPYISGVGFHPANAAIKSRYGVTGVPSGDNIGYVVVVLKRQEVEKNMPSNITVTLAARLSYGTENSFGIGKNEYLVPVLNDEEFADSYRDYEFYDGIGYLRAEDIDETGARISVYSSDSRIIFSERIEKGKTSRDFYLPNTNGGQGIRLSLSELTIPETKARIKVNSEIFDVYQGQTFYNGKCRVLDLQPLNFGAGKATVRCGSKDFVLDRQINKITLETPGSVLYNIGDKVKSDNGADYYLVSANKAKSTGKTFVVIAKTLNNNIAVNDIIKAVARKKYSESAKVNEDKSIPIEKDKIELFALSENENKNSITFRGTIESDNPLGNAEGYFKKAKDGYDFVNTNFGTEAFPESKLSYGEKALWSEYSLAGKLEQQKTLNEVLSRIFNEYPDSVNENKQSASSLIKGKGIVASNSEASQYDEKQDINVELVSVSEPSEADASVSISYETIENGKTSLEVKSGLLKGDVVSIGDSASLTIDSFDENNVKITCSYNVAGKAGSTPSQTVSKGKPISFGADSCNTKVYVEKINLKRVAKVQITPLSYGRSRETNFTFSIGIEKRAIAMNLTPEQANSKMASLQKEIDKYKKISENLGKLIEGGKAACLATSAIINVKNLLAGKNGEASARTEVMKRWNDWCADSKNWQVSPDKKYENSEECIAGEYSANIEPEITATKKAMEDYNTAYNELKSNPSNKLSNGAVDDAKVKEGLRVKIDEIATIPEQKALLTSDNFKYLSYYEVSKLYFDMQVVKNGGLNNDGKVTYNNEIKTFLETAEKRKIEDGNLQNLAGTFGSAMALGGEKTQEARGTFPAWNSVKDKFAKPYLIDDSTKVAVYNYATKGDYLAVLEQSPVKGVYNTKDVYIMEKEQSGKYTLNDLYSPEEKAEVINFRFIEEDATSYTNPCSNCNYMKVFSLEPYRGQPALLPFDFENGFYVQVKNDFPGLGTGNVASYQDSGRVNSFYLCNVGKNKLMESGLNDDTCRRFDFYTGDTLDAYPSLTKTQTKTKVQEALKWLSSAQSQIASNPSATKITINMHTLTVKNAEGDSGSKCTDFMSPSDCQKIFNVCDPFVCPNSRCDFGGKYKVDNVIQSGIIGSTVLCLPNFIGLPGNKDTGVIVPVCITGINAGLQGWISILESYRDCINESVTTGRTVGICDAVHSVYLCDFFWRQAGPLSSAIIKNLFLTLLGKKDTGGGEYLFVNDAWNNAEKSAQFFQTNYAKDSKLSFGFDNLASSVVAEVCKMPVSATYPDKFKTMLEPEIPVQFTATFEELSFNTATVPPTSQYNVFYHIYGGDAGHYFQVYLKSPSTSIGYIGKESVIVASGYVSAGQKASETKNFIDTSGYKQLCVRIDAKEECGFKSVTTSFALNYATEKATSSQATTEATTEAECVNGGHSLGAFLTPNIQQGAEEFINPELYNQGIIRVCSNANPGQGTEPTRWKDVGYCGDRSLRCWIDEKSVAKAIQFKGIQNETLSEIDKLNAQSLEADGFFGAEGADRVKDLREVYGEIVRKIGSDKNKIASVSYGISKLDYNNVDYTTRKFENLDIDVAELDKKLIYSKDRAELWFAKAKIYGDLAWQLYGKSAAEVVEKPAGAVIPVVDTLNSFTNNMYKLFSAIINGGGTIRISSTADESGNYVIYGLNKDATLIFKWDYVKDGWSAKDPSTVEVRSLNDYTEITTIAGLNQISGR